MKKKVEKEEVVENKIEVKIEEQPVEESKPVNKYLDELYELMAKLESLKITRMSDLEGLIAREILRSK